MKKDKTYISYTLQKTLLLPGIYVIFFVRVFVLLGFQFFFRSRIEIQFWVNQPFIVRIPLFLYVRFFFLYRIYRLAVYFFLSATFVEFQVGGFCSSITYSVFRLLTHNRLVSFAFGFSLWPFFICPVVVMYFILTLYLLIYFPVRFTSVCRIVLSCRSNKVWFRAWLAASVTISVLCYLSGWGG